MVGGPTPQQPPMSCYRTLDSAGIGLANADVPHSIDQSLANKIYHTMASLQTIDTIFYEAQRQVCSHSMSCLCVGMYFCFPSLIATSSHASLYKAEAQLRMISTPQASMSSSCKHAWLLNQTISVTNAPSQTQGLTVCSMKYKADACRDVSPFS